ncbi:MAG: hypothetical protein SXA11_22120, partial [Cyanobacteriota bacterium]|nr:hypothetical protein [Cyanobacteriota bacterium]
MAKVLLEKPGFTEPRRTSLEPISKKTLQRATNFCFKKAIASLKQKNCSRERRERLRNRVFSQKPGFWADDEYPLPSLEPISQKNSPESDEFLFQEGDRLRFPQKNCSRERRYWIKKPGFWEKTGFHGAEANFTGA